MIAELEIRKELVRFLTNEISLDDFEDWLVSKSWNMHLDSSAAAQSLASEIELCFSEFSSGHMNMAELRDELTPYATQISVSVPLNKEPVVTVASSNTNVASPAAEWSLGTPAAWSLLGTQL